MLKMFKNRKGFSLVELIVVIAILGVISAIAIPSVLNTLKDSKIKADIATAQSIVKSINLAIVNLNSDSDANNDVEDGLTADLSGLEDADENLYAELNKLYPGIGNLTTQNDNDEEFSITVTTAEPFTGSVSFKASDGKTYTIDQTGKADSENTAE